MDASSSLVPLPVQLIHRVANFTLSRIEAERKEKTEALVIASMKPFTKGWILKKTITRTRAEAEKYVHDCRRCGEYHMPVYSHPFYYRSREEGIAKGFLSAVKHAQGGGVFFSLADAKWITAWSNDWTKHHETGL